MIINKLITNNLLVVTFLILSFHSLSLNAENLSYITPTHIQSVTDPYEHYNDINPSWSSDGKIISYERFDATNHEIVLVDQKGERIKFVSTKSNDEDDLALLLPELDSTPYFAFNISWASDNKQYIFVSNGSSDNFDLYQGNTIDKEPKRITHHESIDNQAQWSPSSAQVVFVSSRDNKANLYLFDISTKKPTSLLSLTEDAINPVWSPDGKKIAFMLGKGNIFQIYVIDDIKNANESIRQLTDLTFYNNIRPSWSPDGSKIAFFTLQTKNNEDQQWDIAVVNSALAQPVTDANISRHIVSSNVIQNSLKGPSWIPDNKHIAYVQYIDDLYNPIHLVNVNNKHQALIITNTKMNRDVSCSSTGTLVFQSQDEQWSRIFTAKLPGFEDK